MLQRSVQDLARLLVDERDAEPGELQVDLEDAFGEMTPMTEATTMREVVGARRLRVRAPAPGSFEV